ncbi:MAG: SIS domain-containing protein [Ekhidna sp.]|nr:SIS domain-containing protein [Ekhidna sp.]
MSNFFEAYKKRLYSVLSKIENEQLDKLATAMIETRDKRGTIYFFGNGGSAAGASHMAGDMLKGGSMGLENKFKTICLSDNNAAMMAIANDISYSDIFIEPLKNYLEKDDLAIGVSGSGRSENVIKAINYAKEKGIKTAGFSGFSGGKLKENVDYSIHIDIHDMEIVEDLHLVCFHMVKMRIISLLASGPVSMGTLYDERTK